MKPLFHLFGFLVVYELGVDPEAEGFGGLVEALEDVSVYELDDDFGFG